MNIKLTLLLISLTSIVLSCGESKKKTESAASAVEVKEPVSQSPQKSVDIGTLAGDWTRTDVPYQIKIATVLNDGSLEAGYYNPKSIHVAKATWTSEEGLLKVYIELRDQNYPGSNYHLIYYPERDMLAGKYFQAVEGETYDVGFSRSK